MSTTRSFSVPNRKQHNARQGLTNYERDWYGTTRLTYLIKDLSILYLHGKDLYCKSLWKCNITAISHLNIIFLLLSPLPFFFLHSFFFTSSVTCFTYIVVLKIPEEFIISWITKNSFIQLFKFFIFILKEICVKIAIDEQVKKSYSHRNKVMNNIFKKTHKKWKCKKNHKKIFKKKRSKCRYEFLPLFCLIRCIEKK